MLQSIRSERDVAAAYEASAAINVAAEAMKAISKDCAAFPPVGVDAKTRNIVSLVAAGAWIEAALALVDIEAPEWSLRRLEIDDGEWFCSLSRHPALPTEFDNAAEGRHRLLPMAILAALADARQRSDAGGARPAVISPRMIATGTAVLCDNVR